MKCSTRTANNMKNKTPKAKILPAISDKAVLRPQSEEHYIPDEEYKEFWDAFYHFLKKNFKIKLPVAEMKNKIDPYFGYFGLRFQATTKTPKYFHLGLDICARARTGVIPIMEGLLEYSGFGHINGKYVFLSHPNVVTEDGFVMHSLYLHLRSTAVGFNSYQKMLRKISLNKYPDIHIKKDQKIGEVGSTGNASGMHPYLHLQVEFRNDAGKIVVIDPAAMFGLKSKANLTENIETEDKFKGFFEEHKEGIKKIGVDKYWKI